VRLLVDGTAVAALEVADTARTRRRGLLGRDGLDGALWLRPCGQVHSVRMRFPIDVAHLDRDGVVLRVVTLRPGRLGPVVLRGRSVVEAEAGRFAEWGVRPGVRLEPGG
jgi:hypothetical protein